MAKSLIIIPARYASSRLPGKPLLAETGKPLIQYTYEAAKASKAVEVIVATDDERIKTTVEGFGGKVAMTDAAHETGTGRVAEAALSREVLDIAPDIIVNMQGDEPEVEPKTLNTLIDVHAAAIGLPHPCFASTLVCPFAKTPRTGAGSPEDPSCVKAVLGVEVEGVRRALYFSRALAPFPRDDDGKVSNPSDWFLHLGLYAFTPETLQTYASMPPSPLEEIEKLEQLRILESGLQMAVGIVPVAAPGIDTPADYQAFIGRQKTI